MVTARPCSVWTPDPPRSCDRATADRRRAPSLSVCLSVSRRSEQTRTGLHSASRRSTTNGRVLCGGDDDDDDHRPRAAPARLLGGGGGGGDLLASNWRGTWNSPGRRRRRRRHRWLMKTKNTERETNNRCSVSGEWEERRRRQRWRRRRMDIIASLSTAALFVHSSDSRGEDRRPSQ